ncbi:cobalt ECF transporter T component CbiQ [Thermosediminibacter oceani]|uniref:Cobalt ABC transporter, inner membrane subunit CbiQ n=1 Tax=Thermosediminibacter oceani (strain ATCC BAA-1034 / DSM 16646 / JW/IW-1228P) TaxID=555079 RepID=D9S0S3_THEOJ|nr:cobalt ECF transporter T component CbiQ [Thermosediminibacter oceani]ADL07087.1 cobalt ABC transporter, inner membrane subunit CbiQ [Thermosediminibacter oceani DSM 16646]
MLLDNFAYNNNFRSVHPGEKLAFGLLMMFLGFISGPIVHLAVFAVMTGILVPGAGIPIRFYLRSLLIPPVFLLPGVLVVVISSGSFDEGMVLFSRSMALVSCFYFIAMTTPVPDILMLMHRLRVPDLFIELSLLTYRYLFVLLDAASRIHVSQNSRLGYAYCGRGLKSMAMLASSLLIKSLKTADELRISLEARGYDGKLRVLDHREYRISSRNIAVILTLTLLLVLLVLGKRIE